jgi:hypothetical protein
MSTTSQNESHYHPDFERNKKKAMEVVERYGNNRPEGLTIYVTSHGFGLSYRNILLVRRVTAQVVKFNQDYDSFCDEANNACDIYQRMAKAKNRLVPDAQKQAKEAKSSKGSYHGIARRYLDRDESLQEEMPTNLFPYGY